MESASPTVDLLERQEWLEPVEGGLQKAVTTAYDSAGPAGKAVRNFLHGKWLGHPLHPVLTDIPIGAWTAALVLDIMAAGGAKECAPGADVAVKVGLVGAVGAAVTGLTDWQATDGRARRIGIVHGLLNLTSASLYTASMICRNRKDRSAGRVLSGFGFAISMAAAYLGGHLVYAKRIGVKHGAALPPEQWIDTLDESELREGEMRRVEAHGVRILLAKQAGRLHAMNEVCTHMGGPLAEGRLEEGTVQCPWHGSRFRLEDGSVANGPATMPQVWYETRVRNGRIEVRPRRD